ncbi:putative E3 ubiquitin-protein ligase rbrA 2 [Colletotrichum chlorophyti]|uniref:RBR-type E3 ubiquitin transferase n=1 Tax=Colletotrichum chlorophyti TaxID=708187 RepID=A0A1Q8RW14_9PEZI|nr:putative E3 ubiquitin-protein ligase rbrA 2 [Colletotrichum chlorophyti]
MEMPTSVPVQWRGYVGFYGDPFRTLRDLEDDAKPVEVKVEPVEEAPNDNNGTESITIELVESVDWEKYEPPSALRIAPDPSNTTLLEVLQTSIDNIKARIVEDERRRQLEDEVRQREAEETAKREAGDKGKEPYLPVVVDPDSDGNPAVASDGGEENLKLFPELVGNGEGNSTRGLIVVPVQPKKRSRLTRILQRMSDNEKLPFSKKYARLGGNPSKSSIEAASDENPASKKLKRTQEVECVSCLDDFHPKEMIKVVCHSYCRECFERLIAAAVQNEQQWPPKCCLNEVPFRTILRYISKDLGKTYRERSCEWKIPVSERIYCNQPDCGLWVKPDQINQGLRIARCTNGHWSCTICRGPQHDNSDCPQDRDLALTNALAEEEGWQHCSQCHALVEHREACQHMTCRCGYQFCYVCNQRWKTCTCTMEHLAAVKAGAATRRQQRVQREAEAETELRDALRQIEEFEREEALKAELLRQETERREQERRQRELEERVRLESLRRHEIEVKYKRLRELFEQVHDLQQVMVRSQHDKEKEIFAHETTFSKTQLEAKQQAERAAAIDGAARKLAAKEKSLAREYAVRVRDEKRMEDAYLQQLEQFFADRPGSEASLEEYMLNYRQKMDKGWRAWKKWRDEEFTRYRFRVDEERTMREEIMYSVRVRHGEGLEERRRELKRRQAAELRWVTAVVDERARMLAEMETTEVEDGSESLFSLSEEGEVTDSS